MAVLKEKASTESDQAIIRLEGVAKTYTTRDKEIVAVSDVSMDIADGDFVSLVGPSGCGKTTILKIVAGLVEPTGGEVLIGQGSGDHSRDIGMVFQQALLLKWRRIIDNVLLPAEILGIPNREARDRARDLLAMVGLAGFENVYPYELSGGMQQRAAIARALIHDPKIVLMDEPFGALDAMTRERMNSELQRIWIESGKTVLFVTHSIQEAVFMGTRCAVLTAGPARMADYFSIDIPQPRAHAVKTDQIFLDYVRRVYELLGVE